MGIFIHAQDNASNPEGCACHRGRVLAAIQKVFCYFLRIIGGGWHGQCFHLLDNSNIFHEAQRLAQERREGPNARYRVRINVDNILRLAHADRPLKKALAAGSVPPEMRQLWNRMESKGVEGSSI